MEVAGALGGDRVEMHCLHYVDIDAIMHSSIHSFEYADTLLMP